MRTSIAAPDAHEEGARRALLERLAAALAVLASADRCHWSCCWLDYAGPGGDLWSWQTCGGEMPGKLPEDRNGRHVTCGHWHHKTEVFLATGG